MELACPAGLESVRYLLRVLTDARLENIPGGTLTGLGFRASGLYRFGV